MWRSHIRRHGDRLHYQACQAATQSAAIYKSIFVACIDGHSLRHGVWSVGWPPLCPPHSLLRQPGAHW